MELADLRSHDPCGAGKRARLVRRFIPVPVFYQMRSECQFFMHPEDEIEFLAHGTSAYPLKVTSEGKLTALTSPHGSIQFLRSELSDSTLTGGRIALATKGRGGEPLFDEGSAASLEGIYRGLCRWLKKRYTNDLVAFSEALPPEHRKVVRYPAFWLGPHARNWITSHPAAVLRQFRSGAVVFTPAGRDDLRNA